MQRAPPRAPRVVASRGQGANALPFPAPLTRCPNLLQKLNLSFISGQLAPEPPPHRAPRCSAPRARALAPQRRSSRVAGAPPSGPTLAGGADWSEDDADAEAAEAGEEEEGGAGAGHARRRAYIPPPTAPWDECRSFVYPEWVDATTGEAKGRHNLSCHGAIASAPLPAFRSQPPCRPLCGRIHSPRALLPSRAVLLLTSRRVFSPSPSSVHAGSRVVARQLPAPARVLHLPPAVLPPLLVPHEFVRGHRADDAVCD